jgi:hypothetical protein
MSTIIPSAPKTFLVRPDGSKELIIAWEIYATETIAYGANGRLPVTTTGYKYKCAGSPDVKVKPQTISRPSA